MIKKSPCEKKRQSANLVSQGVIFVKAEKSIPVLPGFACKRQSIQGVKEICGAD